MQKYFVDNLQISSILCEQVVENKMIFDWFKRSLVVCSKYKEMYGKILKSLTIAVKLYQRMSKLKVEKNVNLPQLSCIVISVALNGEFERFGGFCFDCYYTL